MKITVLGAGMVGSAIAKDLAGEFQVTSVDFSRKALDKLSGDCPSVKVVQADLKNKSKIAAVIKDADLAICAVPGHMGFQTLRSIIECGKNVVDISFFPEDAFELDKLAKSKKVIAVVDCGVAPGFCNIIAGYHNARFDEVERYLCYVGGLPRARYLPYQYRAVFSPSDVIEEYTRPARLVEDGKDVVRPALSEIELIDFPRVGTLEAFNTDGLRSIQRTIKAPYMKEKTLRYPGHAELMRAFRDSGFFGTTPIDVNGQKVVPLEMTSKLLFDQWRMKEGEEDFTVFQTIVEGKKNGKRIRHNYYMVDEFDRATRVTSMARTTGYTCTIVARQVLNGMYSKKGISPPEYVGAEGKCFENLLAEYKKRRIFVTHEETPLG